MTTPRLLVSALMGLGFLAGIAAPAEARESEVAEVLMGLFIIPANTPFLIYDIVVAAKGEDPSFEMALSETVATAHTSLLANAINSVVQVRNPDPISWPSMFIAGALTGMPVHGSLALGAADLRPGERMGVSLSAGMDLTLTTTAVTRAFTKRLSSRPIGILAMATTAPQLAVYAYAAAADAERRGAWIGLSVWSGALLLHGIASTIWGATGNEVESPSPRPRAPVSGRPFFHSIGVGMISGPKARSSVPIFRVSGVF